MEAEKKTVFQEGDNSFIVSVLERLNKELFIQFGKLELWVYKLAVWAYGGRKQLTDRGLNEWREGEKVDIVHVFF